MTAFRLAARVASASRAGSYRLVRGLSSKAASERVRVTRGADGVVEVALSRPEKLNALDMDMFKSIQATANSLIADSSGGVSAISRPQDLWVVACPLLASSC